MYTACDDEATVGPACPVDLVGQGEVSHLAAVGAGQLVEVGRTELRLEAIPFPGRVRPILRSPGPIRRRPRSVGGCLGAELFQLRTQRRVRLRQGAVDVSHARVSSSAHVIAGVGPLIAVFGGGVAVPGRCCPIESSSPAPHGRRFSLAPCGLIRTFIRGRVVAIGGVLAIGRRLVTVRCALIGIGAGLICRRRSLVGVRRGLVGVRRGLVGVARCLFDACGSPSVGHGRACLR